jgi:hypothetical protein
MKITIEHVAENGNSVSAAIEAACTDHDSIASGVIGPSFATSGPGSGWQRNYDASDYAERALSGDYGASSYIDSSDGWEAEMIEVQYWVDNYKSGSANTLSGPFATLDAARAAVSGETEVEIEAYAGTVERLEEHGEVDLVEAYSASEDSEDYEAIYKTGGNVVWSDESVIELACPSLEEAMESPEAYQAMVDALPIHEVQTDLDAWETLGEMVDAPYQVRDSAGMTEAAATLEDLTEIIAEWYDHLVDDGLLEELPEANLDHSTLDALIRTTREWEGRIAEAMGSKDFSGQGSYHVTAADSIGLSLTIGLRED